MSGIWRLLTAAQCVVRHRRQATHKSCPARCTQPSESTSKCAALSTIVGPHAGCKITARFDAVGHADGDHAGSTGSTWRELTPALHRKGPVSYIINRRLRCEVAFALLRLLSILEGDRALAKRRWRYRRIGQLKERAARYSAARVRLERAIY